MATTPETLLLIGARGLGREVALHFARQGWQVVVGARTAADVEQLAREVTAAGGAGVASPCDLQDADSLAALVARARAATGRIELVVSAQTSGARFGPLALAELTDDDLDRVYRAYPRGALHLLQAVGPTLAAQGQGTFVQIGTGSGLTARAGFAHQAAAQHALRGLCQAAHLELKKRGVHVAYLALAGQLDTPASAAYVARRGREHTLPVDDVLRAIEFLHRQDPRAFTAELLLRPAAAE